MAESNGIDKIKSAIATAGYIIGEAMNGMGDTISSTENNVETTGVEKHVESNSLMRALLRGEVTKETQELAYRTYLVNREADRHAEAKKRGVDVNEVEKTYFKDGKIKFTQPNLLNTLTWEESFEYAARRENPEFKYTFEFDYEAVPKVNLQKMSEKAVIDIDESENRNFVTFYLDLDPEYGNEPHKFRMAKNELVKAIANPRFADMALGEVNKITFVTKRAEGELNDIEYTLIKPSYPKVDCYEGDYKFKVTYRCESIQRGDILNRRYSESMAEKYANKEKKELTIGDTKDTFMCVMCECDVTRETMEKTMGILKENHVTPMVLCDSCRDKMIEETLGVRNRAINAKKLVDGLMCDKS